MPPAPSRRGASVHQRLTTVEVASGALLVDGPAFSADPPVHRVADTVHRRSPAYTVPEIHHMPMAAESYRSGPTGPWPQK